MKQNLSKGIFANFIVSIATCLCSVFFMNAENTTSTIVLIQQTARSYYGSTSDNDSLNGVAFAQALATAQDSAYLLLRNSANGGIFQGNFATSINRLTIKGGYSGDAESWSLTDVVTDSSTFDGIQKGRVFELSNVSDTITMTNVVIKNGYVSSNTDYGGGIYMGDIGSLLLNGCTKLINNYSDYYGGAIAFSYSDILIEDAVQFIGNSCLNYGGAIGCHDPLSLSTNDAINVDSVTKYMMTVQTDTSLNLKAKLTITDSVLFYNNSATAVMSYGGAILFMYGSIIISNQVKFDSNIATDYSAIGIKGKLTLRDSVTISDKIGSTEHCIYVLGSLTLQDNIKLKNSLRLGLNTYITVPNGALADSAMVESISIDDPAAGRLVVRYTNFVPTPYVNKTITNGSEMAKYKNVINSGYSLYNGINPYVCLSYNDSIAHLYKITKNDVVMSNNVVEKSFSLYADIPSKATGVTISSNGPDSLNVGKIDFSSSEDFFRYTQAFPGTNYELLFDDSPQTTILINTVALTSYDTTLTNSTFNTTLLNTSVHTIDTMTMYNNLRLQLTPAIGASQGAILNVSDTLLLYDGLCVEVDMNDFIAQGNSSEFAFLCLPFDVNLQTGVRYVPSGSSSSGKEQLARLNTDYRIRLYSSELRSINGQGNQNWVDVTTLPFSSEYVSLTDSVVIPAGTGFIVMIVPESYYGTNATYASGEGPLNNKYRFYANNPNCLGSDKDVDVKVVSNGASSLARHSKYDSGNWQRTWDDGLVLVGNATCYEWEYMPDANLPRYLYERSTEGQYNGYSTIDTWYNNLMPYTAYFAFMTPTILATSENQTISFSGYGNSPSNYIAGNPERDENQFIFVLQCDNEILEMTGIYFSELASTDFKYNEDAIKFGSLNEDMIWNYFNETPYAFNGLPFVGDSMRFELRIHTGNKGIYCLKPFKIFPQGYKVFITAEGENNRKLLLNSGYALSVNTLKNYYVDIVKSDDSDVETINNNSSDGSSIYLVEGNVILKGGLIGSTIEIYTTSGALIYSVKCVDIEQALEKMNTGIYMIKWTAVDGEKINKIVIN